MTSTHTKLWIHNQYSIFRDSLHWLHSCFIAMVKSLSPHCRSNNWTKQFKSNNLLKRRSIYQETSSNQYETIWFCLKFPQYCFGIMDKPSTYQPGADPKLLGSWTPAAHSQRCAVPNFSCAPRVVSGTSGIAAGKHRWCSNYRVCTLN